MTTPCIVKAQNFSTFCSPNYLANHTQLRIPPSAVYPISLHLQVICSGSLQGKLIYHNTVCAFLYDGISCKLQAIWIIHQVAWILLDLMSCLGFLSLHQLLQVNHYHPCRSNPQLSQDISKSQNVTQEWHTYTARKSRVCTSEEMNEVHKKLWHYVHLQGCPRKWTRNYGGAQLGNFGKLPSFLLW